MEGEIKLPQDAMCTESTDTQEVTCHVVEAEVHAAHGHMSDSADSWMNFSSQNDLNITVPAERSFDRNLFEFLNDDDDDDDLSHNRLTATKREKTDRNLFECEFWKLSSDLDEGQGHLKKADVVSCGEMVQDSYESDCPINVTMWSGNVDCPIDCEHPPTTCQETENNVTMVSDGLECPFEDDQRHSIPDKGDPERDDSTPGRGSVGPGKDSSTFDRSFDGTETRDTALDEHFSRCGLSPIPWVLDDEKPRRKWTTEDVTSQTGSDVDVSSTIVVDDEAPRGAKSEAPGRRNFAFNFQAGDNETQVVPRSSPPGGVAVAYLASVGFVMNIEDQSLVADSVSDLHLSGLCGRCSETGFKGKSVRDEFTLPHLVKPFGNFTPMRERESDGKATNIRKGRKRIQPCVTSSYFKKPRTTTNDRLQSSYDSQMNSSSACDSEDIIKVDGPPPDLDTANKTMVESLAACPGDSEDIIQIDGPPPDLDTANKTMVESLAACAGHCNVNSTNLESIENAVCDVIPGGAIDKTNQEKLCNTACEITGVGELGILEDNFLPGEIKNGSKQEGPGKNVPETNERCDSDCNETGATYCKQFSDSSDTEPLLDLSDLLLQTLPRQSDDLQLLPRQQQHDDDCNTTLPSIDTDLLWLSSGLSDQSVSVAGSLEDLNRVAECLEDLNSVSLDLELLTPLQNDGLKTTIDTYLNDSQLDEEVYQIFSSSMLKKNGDISIDLDSVMTVLEGERRVSNASLTCHENFLDFEKNLSPCDIKEESEITYRPLTPEGASGAFLPSSSPGCASKDELKPAALGDVSVSDPQNLRKRKLQFNGARSNSKKTNLNVIRCPDSSNDRNSQAHSQPGSASEQTLKLGPCAETRSNINETSGYPGTPAGLKPTKKSSRTKRKGAERLKRSDREAVRFEAVNRTVTQVAEQMSSDVVLEHVLDKVLDDYRSQPCASCRQFLCNDRSQILDEVRNGELAPKIHCESVQKLGQKSGHDLGEVLSTLKQDMQCEQDTKVFVKKIEFGAKQKRLRLSLTARRQIRAQNRTQTVQIRAQNRAQTVTECVPTLDHNYFTSWDQATSQGAGSGQGSNLRVMAPQGVGSLQGPNLKVVTSQGVGSGQGTNLRVMAPQGAGSGCSTPPCYPLSYTRRKLPQVDGTCSGPVSNAQDLHHKSSEVSATSVTAGKMEGATDLKNPTSTATATNGIVAGKDGISERSACVKDVKRKQVNKGQGRWRPSILRVSSTTPTQRMAPPAGSTQNLIQSNPCVRAPPSVTRVVSLGGNQVNHHVKAPPTRNQITNQDTYKSNVNMTEPSPVTPTVSQHVNSVKHQVETHVSNQNLNHSMSQNSLKVTSPPSVTRIINLDMNQVNHQVAALPGINQSINQIINQSDSQVTRVVNMNQIFHQVTAHPPIKQNQEMAVVVPRRYQGNSSGTGLVSNGSSRCVPAVFTMRAGNAQQTVTSSFVPIGNITVTSLSVPVCNPVVTSSSTSGNKIRYIPPAVINHTAPGLHPPRHQGALSSGHTWAASLNDTERAPQNPKVYAQSMTANQLTAMATGHGNGCQVIKVTVPSRKKVSPQ